MEFEISCGFVLINSKSKKILLLKLAKEFEWDLPRGHQDKGETNIQTALREVEEQTKISSSDISVIKAADGQPISKYYDYTSPVSGNARRIYLFIGETKKDPLPSDEHCGYSWCSLKEGLKYLRFDEIQKCVEELYGKYIASINK